LGVDWIAQVEPFHRSARVKVLPVLVLKLPTDVHMVDDEHETAVCCADVDVPGLGVDWIVQMVPFHASARVAVLPPDGVQPPTATHAVELVHETPARLL
jgi:hypothetical protein